MARTSWRGWGAPASRASADSRMSPRRSGRAATLVGAVRRRDAGYAGRREPPAVPPRTRTGVPLVDPRCARTPHRGRSCRRGWTRHGVGLHRDRLDAPASEVDRFLYGFSLMVCVTDGLSRGTSVGTGTVMRPSTFRRYATEAGFREVEPSTNWSTRSSASTGYTSSTGSGTAPRQPRRCAALPGNGGLRPRR